MLDFSTLNKVEQDFMNRDHEEAVALLNSLQGAAEMDDLHGVVSSLAALISHCQAHFEREEISMRKYSFPPYIVHKQEHDRVLMELNMIAEQLKSHGEIEKIRRYVIQEFPAWFVQHLSTMDKMTAQYLAMRQKEVTDKLVLKAV